MTLRDLTHHLDLFITSPMSGETVDPSIHQFIDGKTNNNKSSSSNVFFLIF